MRSAGLAACLAATTAAGAALADSPEDFPDKFFAIDFPASPAVTTGTYDAVTPSGARVSVPATVYSVQQDGAFFAITVADLANSAADDRHALDHAIKAYRQRNDLALDTAVSHSLTGSRFQLCGRHFGYASPDDQLNYETLYYNPNTRLFYDVRSSVTSAAQSQHGADVQHFQTSLALHADPKSQLPPPPAYPENWKLYHYPDVGFSIRFPAEPIVEQGSYTTDSGIAVPAVHYRAREGDALFQLTVATYWGTPASSDEPGAEDPVDGAARLWKRRGQMIADESVAISNGQCGRDVTSLMSEGRLSRASIFFPATQHKLYIVEVTQGATSAAENALEDRRFRESLALATAQ